MLKFFNDNATVIYQKDIATVQVTFNGSGSYEGYLETLRVAEGIGNLYYASAYLLEKRVFDDVSAEEFGRFFLQWLARLHDQAQDKPRRARQRVALLVPPSAFSVLLDHCLDQSGDDPFGITYKIFTSRDQAYQFVGSEPSGSTQIQ